jgi:hypothetical protein
MQENYNSIIKLYKNSVIELFLKKNINWKSMRPATAASKKSQMSARSIWKTYESIKP